MATLDEAEKEVLRLAAERLDDYAAELAENGDYGTWQLAKELRSWTE